MPTKSKPRRSVADFVKQGVPRPSRCVTCREPEVAAAIADFSAMRDEQYQPISWRAFWSDYVRGEMGSKLGYSATMGHVRRCLNGEA